MNDGRPFGGTQADELAGIIGQAAVIRLCEAIGGVGTYVPKRMTHNHEIALVIGIDLAAKVAEHVNGGLLRLPKANVRRQRAIELAKSGRMTIREAALATDYSERQVYRLICPDDDGQMDLFARR